MCVPAPHAGCRVALEVCQTLLCCAATFEAEALPTSPNSAAFVVHCPLPGCVLALPPCSPLSPCAQRLACRPASPPLAPSSAPASCRSPASSACSPARYPRHARPPVSKPRICHPQSLLPPGPATAFRRPVACRPLQASASDVQQWLSQGVITDHEAKSFSPTQLEFMARKRMNGGGACPGAAPPASAPQHACMGQPVGARATRQRQRPPPAPPPPARAAARAAAPSPARRGTQQPPSTPPPPPALPQPPPGAPRNACMRIPPPPRLTLPFWPSRAATRPPAGSPSPPPIDDRRASLQRAYESSPQGSSPSPPPARPSSRRPSSRPPAAAPPPAPEASSPSRPSSRPTSRSAGAKQHAGRWKAMDAGNDVSDDQVRCRGDAVEQGPACQPPWCVRCAVKQGPAAATLPARAPPAARRSSGAAVRRRGRPAAEPAPGPCPLPSPLLPASPASTHIAPPPPPAQPPSRAARHCTRARHGRLPVPGLWLGHRRHPQRRPLLHRVPVHRG